MKILKSDLKKVLSGKMTLSEARLRSELLREDVPTTQVTDPAMLENDSIDSQIDRFLMQGESNKNAEMDGENTAAPAMESFLREAEGDDPNAIPGAAPAPEAGAAPDAPPDPPPQQPAQKSNQQLDAVTFADNVARLVEKNGTLLDLKGTICRRALNWVTKNYDAKQSKEVKQILEGNFGITPDNAEDPYEDDMAPPAAGAGSGLGQ